VLKKVGVGDVRYLRVTKLRGSSFFTGEHAFRIGKEGLELFPRFTTPDAPIDYRLATERSPTGVRALDPMLFQGFWKGSSTVVFGPPGSGKTLLGLHFIFRGIEMGEKGLVATMQENPTQLQRIAKGFGRDLEEVIASGMLTLMYVSPVDIYLDEFVSRVTQEALAHGVQRLLVDSINDLHAASPAEGRFRDFMYSLTQAMAVNGISVFMTHEVGDLLATTVLSKEGISNICDNVLLLSYVRDDSRIKRAISVIKTRASDHDPAIREFTITSEGIVLGDEYSGPLFPAQG
jgi:circadian clock protein KaiC